VERELFGNIRRELMMELEQENEWEDIEILNKIDELVLRHTRRSRLSVSEKEDLRRELFYSVRKLDILQVLLDDDQVTEIMVNGYQDIFFEKNGKKIRWDKVFISKEKAGGCSAADCW